jgi:hypothetical protein
MKEMDEIKIALKPLWRYFEGSTDHLGKFNSRTLSHEIRLSISVISCIG